MPQTLVKHPPFDLKRSYLAAIENSVGTKMFRNRYYMIRGKPLDVLDDGDLACAVYVTSVLYLFGLIREVHTSVKETIKDLEKSGWKKTKKPQKGAVILWDYRKLRGGKRGINRHVGFYINKKTAISNSSKKRRTAQHHITYGVDVNGRGKRDILAFYWHKKLSKQ